MQHREVAVVEGLMDAVRWLWFPMFFPLGGIVAASSAAVVTYRGAARARRVPVPAPLIIQPWAWVGVSALAVFALLVAGLAVIAPEGVLLFAGWLSLPMALIALVLVGPRR